MGREYTGKTIRYLAEFAHQAACDGEGGQRRILAFIKGLEHREHNGSVRDIDHAVDRKAWESDNTFHTGFGKCNLRHFLNYRLGSVQRRSRRQLCNTDEIIFVLSWDKPAGYSLEPHPCHAKQPSIDEQDERAQPHGASHRPDIGIRRAVEEPVEDSKNQPNKPSITRVRRSRFTSP